MPERADNLLAFLHDDAAAGGESVEWLRDGMRRWLFDGDGLPLPRVLGLPGTPQRCRIALRDCALRNAAARLEGSMWQRACELHARAVTFERGPWKRLRSADAPPAQLDELHRHIWIACRAWPLPARVQSFLEIIA